ncbi:hypothetical protein AB205_0110280 [Aquarana catesbeiana]|uniref:Uncharacterized protein n=1 Tax=Aquarana catesbeiana TaxID=8400 RepID=A0A2G9PQ56_AQUCT|nr:hypothetical protein AB205_0110280 [Aquarana catesbeiana]
MCCGSTRVVMLPTQALCVHRHTLGLQAAVDVSLLSLDDPSQMLLHLQAFLYGFM